MKPVAAMAAITVLVMTVLVTTGLLAGPVAGSAMAAPGSAAVPAQDEDTPLVAGPLRLDLAEVAPRVVTAGGPRLLTVTGTLRNTGALPVDELVIRVQRGNPLGSEGELRDALDGTAGTDAVTPRFTELPGVLAPGAERPIRLSVPLRGAPEDGLALATTGVHELLVNVNGVPADGARARLAAVRFLLPVLSLPPDPALPPDPDGPDGVPDAPTGGATPFAMLYPITETPRRIATVPGEPTLLTDDDLAASFAQQGRLGGLVAALAEVAPAGSRTRDATCVAVDPDLVETAAQMSAGYQFRRPDGVAVPGVGAEQAGRWLTDLAAVARGTCVIALPRSDADLVALTRGGLGALAVDAITDGRQTLVDLLGTPVVPGVTWPADGVVDAPTLEPIEQAGGRSLLLSADGVEQARVERGVGVLPIEEGQQFAVLTDPLLTQAAAGPGADQGLDPGRGLGSPVSGAAVTGNSPAGTVGPLSTQDLIGALAHRTEAGGTEAGSGPLVLAPPHLWAADGTGARALLAAVEQLLAAGRLAPRALDRVLAAGPPADVDARPVAYPSDAEDREIPREVVDIVRATSAAIEDLSSSAVEGTGVGATPVDTFTPLRRGLLRPTSATWRADPAAAERSAAVGAARIGELRASVRVLEPPSPYSLGTSDAPILITVANGLPVTVEVRVEIAPSSGLRVAPIGTQQIPPLGRRQVRVSAEVTRSGQFTVQASVLSRDGGLLGPPSRLRVRSTAYGTITLWLTASAGVLLVVLAVRRVLRRVRGEPGRHSVPDRRPPQFPQPDPPPAGRRRQPDLPAPGGSPRTGDPFPDPAGVTDRIPTARPRPDGPRPPGPPPPRVPSP